MKNPENKELIEQAMTAKRATYNANTHHFLEYTSHSGVANPANKDFEFMKTS